MSLQKWPGHPNAIAAYVPGSAHNLQTFAQRYEDRPDKRPYIIQAVGSCQQWVVYPIDDQTIVSQRCQKGIDMECESFFMSSDAVWTTLEHPNFFILVDEFCDEPIEHKCTCDFRGANCWAGCTCGYMKESK